MDTEGGPRWPTGRDGSEIVDANLTNQRTSTARPGGGRFVEAGLRTLGFGILVNLGAGTTARTTPGAVVINVDHVLPSQTESGIFVVADVTALPFRNGAFNGILAKDVLEHLQDPIRALREARAVARPDCQLLLTVPRAIARAVWDDPTHVRGFTSKALRTALKMSGWREDIPIHRMGGIPGAGRLRLDRHLETILRLPMLGHWFGTNWIVRTSPSSQPSPSQ